MDRFFLLLKKGKRVMAKFCMYCGKPLEAGVPCDCEGAKAAAAAATAQNVQTAGVEVSEEFTADAAEAVQETAAAASEQLVQEQSTADQAAVEAQAAAEAQAAPAAQASYQQVNTQQTYQQDQSQQFNQSQQTYQQGQSQQFNQNQQSYQQGQSQQFNQSQQTYQQGQNQQFNQNQQTYQQGQSQQFNQNRQSFTQSPQFQQAQQQAAPFIDELKFVVSQIPAIFKDPAGTAKAMVYRNKKETGISMILLNAVVAFLVMFIFAASLNSKIRNALGYYSSYYDSMGVSPVRYAFMVLLMALVIDFVLAGCVTLCDKTIFHGTLDFKGAMNLVGTKYMIDTTGYVIGGVLCILSPVLGIIVMAAAVAFSSFALPFMYREVCVLNSSKGLYSFLLIMIFNTIIVSIISGVVAATEVSQMINMIQYLM